MNADQRLEELFHQLANYERTRAMPVVWSLDTMHALLAGDGARPDRGVWVQVGGSKGKGTTVLYLAALAAAAGLRTGAFVSPHVEHVTERVQVDGEPVAAEELVTALESVLDFARELAVVPSFFEAITAAAVRLFRAAAVDFVALEVGLGGRLDATTAIPVDATILTRIELEHTDLLGDTLAAIATEKACIMRPGKPAWFEVDPATEPVLRAYAERVGAEVQPPPAVRQVRIDAERIIGEFASATGWEAFSLVGASEFELTALAASHACLRRILPGLALSLLPVRRPALPGRFEVMPQPDGWPVVLDGAHTPGSSAQVVAELHRRFPGQPVVLLFATAEGKRWKEGLRHFLPVVDRVVVTDLAGMPSADPCEVASWLQEQGTPAQVTASAVEGLADLSRSAAVRLVVGSFYLVGAVRRLLSP